MEFNTKYNITSCLPMGADGVFGEGCEEAGDIDGEAIAGEAIILKNRAGVSLRIEVVIICEYGQGEMIPIMEST